MVALSGPTLSFDGRVVIPHEGVNREIWVMVIIDSMSTILRISAFSRLQRWRARDSNVSKFYTTLLGPSIETVR